MCKVMDQVITAIAHTEQPAIHLVDLENLIGSGKFNVDHVRAAHTCYVENANCRPGDVIVIASGPQNRSAIYEGWRSAAYIWQKGQDGADLALLALMTSIEDLHIFSEVVIASGDGLLANVAQLASTAGLPVRVVSRPEARSRSLMRLPFRPFPAAFNIPPKQVA